MMTIDSIRKYCLSFPHVTEKLQWGETLCFKVRSNAEGKKEEKIFALMNLDAVPPGLCIKCSPESFAELTEIEGIIPAPYLGRYKWVLLENLDVLPAREIENLIAQSYEMVVTKMKPAKIKTAKIKLAKIELEKIKPKKKTKRAAKRSSAWS
jgi:predicted DNA-binding protein (MmcQ/YjbR family)